MRILLLSSLITRLLHCTELIEKGIHFILFYTPHSEFLKQLDEELPFFYETASQRFKSGKLEAPEGTFDEEEEGNPLRLHTLKPRTRDSTALFIAGRASLPAPGSKTIRTTYHKAPSDLPRVRQDHDYS